MKYFVYLFIILTFGTSDLHSQKVNVDVLETAIEYEVFLRNFYPCQTAYDTIFIHDGDAHFDQVSFKLCEKVFFLTHEPSNYHPSTITDIFSVDPHRIVLYRIDHLSEENYKLYFWRPSSGAALRLLIEEDENGFRVYEYREGAF